MKIRHGVTRLTMIMSLASAMGASLAGCGEDDEALGAPSGNGAAPNGNGGPSNGAAADAGIQIPHIQTGPGVTNVVVAASKNPAATSNAITFVAAIAPATSTSTYPTGSVYFTVDGIVQPPATVQNGSASITVPGLAAGDHDVTATYIGDPTYAEKTSAPYKQLVRAAFEPPWHGGIDVTKHGIVGDGATDNTASIRQLIDSLPVDSVTNTTGGQLLYFPAGTYVVTDTIDLSKLMTFAIEGDVDEAGNPTSILKSTSIATSVTLNDVHASYTGTFNPMVKTGVGNNGMGGSFQIRNMQFVASDQPGSVAFLVVDGRAQSFENCGFTAFRGLQVGDGVNGLAVRNSKFVGHGVPGSIGLAATSQLVEGSTFTGWGDGIRVMHGGLSVAHSTFEKNGTGMNLGDNTLTEASSYAGGLALDDLHFKDNDVGAYLSNCSATSVSGFHVEGSTNAPSGQSQTGLRVRNSGWSTFAGLDITGSFAKAPIEVISGSDGLQNSSFYAPKLTNTASPSAPTWMFGHAYPCPGNSTCALTDQGPYAETTVQCAAGTMTVKSASYFTGTTTPTDCTAYMAAQCNGKASCIVSWSRQNCPATGGDGPDFATASIACSAGAPNVTTSNLTYSDTPLANFVAEQNDVTASYVVSSAQPTASSNAMVVDVTKHGVVADGKTDNAAALQGLIDAAAAGAVFYFPQGTYSVSTTLDFSHLSSFTVLGDARSLEGNQSGSTIAGTFGDKPVLKMDYGSGAGSFQLRYLNIAGGSDAVFAKNAVLSNIQDVQPMGNKFGIHLENPFMVSMRSAFARSGATDGAGIAINGGMRSTVEVHTMFGGTEGVRMAGTGHAVFSTAYESMAAAISLGVDPDGKPAPLAYASVAANGGGANVVQLNVVKCQHCSLAAAGSRGLHDTKNGLFVDEAEDSSFAAMMMGGACSSAAILVTSKAKNLVFADINGANGAAGSTPEAVAWLVQDGASNITFDQATGR